MLHVYHVLCLHRLCFQFCTFQGKMDLLFFKVIMLRSAAFAFTLLDLTPSQNWATRAG